MSTVANMTDIQLLDYYIDQGTNWIDPRTWRHIESRGLVGIANAIPYASKEEQKATLRALLGQQGKAFEDEEITQIANTINRIEYLRIQLSKMNMANPKKYLPLLEEMSLHANSVLDYYK